MTTKTTTDGFTKKIGTTKTIKPEIDLSDDDFGVILNCAVRYAIGRQTYMPSLVTGFIKPLIPYLNDKTLWCFDEDIKRQEKWPGGYGDPRIDKPTWMNFWDAIKTEIARRDQEKTNENY